MEFLWFMPETGPPPEEWIERNDAVLRLGLDWIDRRLSGGAADESRSAWLAARAEMIASRMPAALDRIAQRFALAPFDEDVLMLALASAIDGSLAARFAAAQGRPNAMAATPYLVALIFFGQHALPLGARRRLGRNAPLRRHALIGLDDTSEVAVTAAITVPERIVDTLCGIDRRDRMLDGIVRPLDPVPIPERLEALATEIIRAGQMPLRLQVVGPRRSGRAALAASIMGRLGHGALEVSGDANLAPAAAVLARDATLDGCGIVLNLNDAGEYGPAAAQALIRNFEGALIVVAEAPTTGLEAVPVLRLDPLEPIERAGLWKTCARCVDDRAITAAAEQFALGPTEIAAVAAQSGLAERGLWAACRDLGAGGLEDFALRVSPRRTWDDLVLADETMADLRALTAQVLGRPMVYGEWGFRRRLGRASGVSALFAGPSGVGKTAAAEVVARDLDLDLYVVDLSRVASKYIGETEKNLRRIFDAAEAGGAVLFFDEADALFGKRSEVKDSHDRYANTEISYLLQRMERYGGLTILATNLKGQLDSAFLRRLRVVVDFPMPDTAARLRLWRHALPPEMPLGRIDWPALARLDLSGGNIVTIVANAAFRAAADGGRVEMTHLRAAVTAELRKLDRDASGLEPRS